ncbi:hypothetical protein ABB37_09730 [Leptomonas pyrrhocoris]|uniref:Uncharacterized protein n=1 Tax=Leptomonas pyrrhocoris TaxID=157538 RepID=A0A0N0DQX1_LEPPY|nr:hypothetical protein ABB37_09730 [Leptomonas pyrrhocoris]KPA73598.1 hypothetical protein ABB37_09730 [Leptomonas pyrrhocoris]|eukprot:XP_015652037.1 hypothetical protein ABB37_09730 [Leptomonas pyrrhocoris]
MPLRSTCGHRCHTYAGGGGRDCVFVCFCSAALGPACGSTSSNDWLVGGGLLPFLLSFFGIPFLRFFFFGTSLSFFFWFLLLQPFFSPSFAGFWHSRSGSPQLLLESCTFF